jgi:pimeloyl-ACP methyl ester carboxylesterase
MPALMWHQSMVPPLVAAGYEAITFDNRGVPPSDCPEGPYSMDGFVADAAALMEQLDVGPARVLGFSMGGCIAQELALARPDLVRAVAIAGTRARHSVYTRANLAGQIDLFRAFTATPISFFVPFLLGQMLTREQLDDDAIVQSFLDPMLASPPWYEPGRIEQYEAYLDYDDRLGALRALTPPALVFSFADDILVPAALGREVADAIPQATFELIPRQNHYGMLLAVDEIMAILTPFFAGA